VQNKLFIKRGGAGKIKMKSVVDIQLLCFGLIQYLVFF